MPELSIARGGLFLLLIPEGFIVYSKTHLRGVSGQAQWGGQFGQNEIDGTGAVVICQGEKENR